MSDAEHAANAQAVMMPYFLKIRLADKSIELESCNKRILSQFRAYIASFEEPDYRIKLMPNDVYDASNDDLGITPYRTDDLIAVEYPTKEALILHRRITEALLEDQIILIHGAAISLGGQGYVFIAPSGTGKTTHILNWKQLYPDTVIINGDKPFIDVTSGRIYGSPWCGKEGLNTNTSAPLCGMIELVRGEQNMIQRITWKDFLPVLLKQIYIPNEREKCLRAYDSIGKLKGIPCYRLYCNMNVDSAAVAYAALRTQENHEQY